MLACALVAGFALTSVAQAAERVQRGKDRGVTFRLISPTDQAGYEAMEARNGETVYVSTQAAISEGDIVSIGEVDGQIDIALTPNAAQRVTGANRLAVVDNGRLVATPELSLDADNVARLSGLTVDQVNRLTRVVRARGEVMAGPVINLVPSAATVAPGGEITVDVFVSNASNVRTYQVAIDAEGGDAGALTRSEVWIDADRADYLFGTAQAIKAVDDVHGRAGAVLFDGGVNAMSPMYVGTYTFEASTDASGSFVITPRVGEDTFLSDPEHVHIAYRVEPVTVTISQ